MNTALARTLSAVLLAMASPLALFAQTPLPPAPAKPAAVSKADADAAPRLPRSSDRRRASKLYLKAGKLFLAQKFEDAMRLYTEAAELDPATADYRLAIEVARNHAVTALVQSASKARLTGNAAASRAALARALAFDPNSPLVTQHLYELSDDALRALPEPAPSTSTVQPGPSVTIVPSTALRSFHLYTDARQTITQVFRSYGIEVTLDDSIVSKRFRFDIDNASFEQASSVLAQISNTFYVPIDSNRALVARDTHELRQQYTRLDLETLYLAGLTANELTEVANLAKSVFGASTAVANATTSSLTVRAAPRSLDAFNRTLQSLIDGHSQVLLDVTLVQLAHSNERNTGVTAPQSVSGFNVYAEEQSILNSNSTLVQEIISSGLASADNPLAIIAILIESGSVSSSLFSGGIGIFGGGITETGVNLGSITMNLNVNSSDSRQLDRIQLRLADGEAGTLRLGSRYPIQTSTYSSSYSSSSISGLTTSGTSSALSALLSSTNSSTSSLTPQIEYQDLGFTLKATPNVMRNDRVALSLTLKIDNLSGTTLSGNPILNSRSYEGIIQVKEGDAAVIAGELDKSESGSISGTPGVDEIPGLSSTADHDKKRSSSTLVVVVTPHIVRSPLSAGHTPALRIDRGSFQNN
jgi:general secretion pathway protein D